MCSVPATGVTAFQGGTKQGFSVTLPDPLIPTAQLLKSKAFSRPQAVMRTWEESKGWRLQSITDRTPAHSIHPIDLFGLNFPETKFSLGSFPTKKKLDGIYP